MGWKERFSITMVMYVSLIENGETEYGKEGKNILHYAFVYLS